MSYEEAKKTVKEFFKKTLTENANAWIIPYEVKEAERMLGKITCQDLYAEAAKEVIDNK